MNAPHSGLFTDFYQLTMAQGYFSQKMGGRRAAFDLFFRKQPFDGGFSIAAGLDGALEFLENVRFGGDDIAYLKERKVFTDEFLDHLRDFRFTGEVHAVPEGTPVFPMAPLLRVSGPLEQCQIVESPLLNIVNFQSLIATKAARISLEAGRDNVLEFGMRRAQGFNGALAASRAAYIGGCMGTSCVLAGKAHGIPVSGTHAHSWVMAFPDELSAFRAFADLYPDNCILLVDTVDTLKSGIPNAIAVGRELAAKGHRLRGVRLDSGDLAYLSIEARKMLDAAGLDHVKIVASGELDERIIHDLRAQGAKIDIFGVGTKLVTAEGSPSFSGIYKLAAVEEVGGAMAMKIKLSDNIGKSTLPGIKQVWRLRGGGGEMMADLIDFEGERHDFAKGVWGYHPFLEYERKFYDGIAAAVPLLTPVMKDGKRLAPPRPLADIRAACRAGLETLHPTMRRLLNPHLYKVSLGRALFDETRRLRIREER